MTTLSWDLVGGDPAPGEPSVYRELSQDFSTTAQNAESAHLRLTQFGTRCDDSVWRGEAADAFRAKIKELPPKLSKLHHSYDTASRAMADYGGVLDSLQPRARTLLERAQAARQDQSIQEANRDQARAQAPDPGILGFLSTPSTPFDQAVDDARNRQQDVRSQIDDLRDERRAAESRAVACLDRAHDQGMKNDSWLSKRLHDIDKWVDKHADILKKISGALKLVSTIAGLLSFIPFLAPIFGPISLIASGAALLIDATLCATGNGSWKALAVDAALMALPAAGKLLKVGSKAARARGLESARPPGGFTSKLLRSKGVQFAKKALCGDPIDVATGDMVMSETDLELPGLLPLVLSRTYVSSYREGRSFGVSWASTLDQRIEVDDAGVCFVASDGMVLVYPVPAGAAPVLPAEGPRWPLARTGERYTVEVEDGRTLHFTPGRAPGMLPLAAITDRNGHRIDLDYDADGVISEVRHSAGQRIRVETSGGLVRALHLRGAGDNGDDDDIELVRYGYARGQLTEIVNSSALPLRFVYDAAGRITDWEDRNGVWYHYTYDDEGRCVRTSGTDGCMDGTFSYAPDERTTVWTNSLGQATTFHLNHLLQVVREVDPLGHVTVSTWDRYDRLLSRTDPLGRTSRWQYDESGNLVAVTRPDGLRATAEYNRLGLPTTVAQFDGATWRQAYDERGNLVALEGPLGGESTYDYDELGHLRGVTDALGQTRRVELDRAGLPISITDPLGATTRYDRDRFGRVVTTTDPVGGRSHVGWTAEGRLAWRTLPDGATERWAYDGEGNLVEHVDTMGQRTRTEFTSFDLPAAESGPGGRLEFSYDTELRLVAVTNPQGLQWRYEYDAAGNLAAETDFNGRELRYAHDAAGQLVERTNGAGETTRLVRDLLGNVIERQSGGSATTFAYDPAGRMVRATNAHADLGLHRDLLGRVLAETCNGRTVTSSYDLLGRRIDRRTPSGAGSAWEYDANHQPVALHTAGRTVRFGYDAAGREVERQLGAGAVLAQTWDANHQLLVQSVTAPGIGADAPASARRGRLVQHRSYRYRPDGCVTDIDDHLAGNRALDLDPAARVTAVHGAGWSERYAYDAAGNVVDAAWPAGPADSHENDARGEREYAGSVLRRAGNVRYEHDAQGRVVLRQQKRLSAKPRTWRYRWDGDDRLVAVTTPDGGRWRYRYDPLGRRIAKERLATDGELVVERVDFTWDDTVLAEQTRDSTGRTTVWEWQPGTFRPVSQTDRGPRFDPSQEQVDERFFAIVTDLVGTPTELVEPDGTLAWHARTTLFGVPVEAGTSGTDCPLRFPGQYFDGESGLSYNYFRYFDPAATRYQTSDPIGLAGGYNPHAYVFNPLTSVDPLGLKSCVDPDGLGPLGETASEALTGLRKNTRRIPSASRGRTFRIPDHMDGAGRYIAETKNVAKQHLSSQLLDDVAHVNRGGLPGRVDVIVDTRTQITRPLLRAHLDPGNPIHVRVENLNGP